MIMLESSHWRLWCEPEVGVQWLGAQVKREDQWHHVVPDCRPDVTQPAAGQSAKAQLGAANFHMIPYSNRIRDGRFTFQGESVQLENAQNHAIHGALRKLPWQVRHADQHSLICGFDSRSQGAINWPWPVEALIEQRVLGQTLSSTITITNHGDSPMPAGTGWHPYFVRQIGGAMPTLTLPVDAVFPDASGDCLPDGPAEQLPAALDFRQARQLDPDQRIDCCLSGLSGTCHIHWQEAGIELLMRASEQCRYLVLFNPDMPHFALEPVTNANDAFNLASRDIESGIAIIDAGQSYSAQMELQLQLHNP